MNTPNENIRWTCPDCGKRYSIKPNAKAPTACPSCRSRAKEISDDASTVTALNALAAAVDADQMAKLMLPVVRPRKQKAVSISAITCAVVILAGIVAYFSSRTLPPSGENAYQAISVVVASFLKAPKTAEFPQPGGIHKIIDVKDCWRIDSYVDSKNPLGVLVRSRWECIVVFNTTTKKYIPYLINIDGEEVFASDELQEVREQERQEIVDAVKERRRNDKWERITTFEGDGDEITAGFKTTISGFRIGCQCARPLMIHVYTKDNKLVTTLQPIHSNSGTQFVGVPAGEYRLKVRKPNASAGYNRPWSILVEE